MYKELYACDWPLQILLGLPTLPSLLCTLCNAVYKQGRIPEATLVRNYDPPT